MSAAPKQQPEQTVTMVFPANIMSVWNEAEPMLKRSVDMLGTHTTEDVRKMLLAGAAQLWVGWNNRLQEIDWLMVTEFVNYPQGVWLRVWLAGAPEKRKTDWAPAEEAALDFMMANKCAGIEELGREGWARRHEGFTNTAKSIRLFRYKVTGD